MNINFLTSNQNKLLEIQEILGDVADVNMRFIELDEIQSSDAEKVLFHKIEQAKNALPGEYFIVEDTCLYLGQNKDIGPLIKFLPNERVVMAYQGEEAEAVCSIGCSDGLLFQGILMGKIVQPRGNNGFGWDHIFQPAGSQKTLAEMSKEEKNSISMRKIALIKFRDYLIENNNPAK